MAVSKSILGMNARNFLYIRPYNRAEAKKNADDKLATKKLLIENDIATPDLLAAFYDRDDVRNFDWDLPQDGFVIKPARGYGGSGILAFKRWENNIGTTISGDIYTQKQVQAHLLDILDGAFSLQYLPDKAFIESLIVPHPFFKKVTSVGIADIRIIVFRHVPVMAMMRIPTDQSEGKANLQLGALAAGIDIRTGITTHAMYHTHLITRIPDTKTKAAGIKLPDWDSLLLLAAKTQAVIGLGFAGVDLVIDAKKGPMILEVNARPGLKIQNANLASLRTRLERVEGMEIPSPERGVELAKSLFAEAFAEKVQIAPKVLAVISPVIIKHADTVKEIEAKLDTGAYRTSIDAALAKELDLPISKEKVYVQSASGKSYRPTAPLSFELGGKKMKTIVSVVNRSYLRYPMIVGRKDLQGFLINPEMKEEEEER